MLREGFISESAVVWANSRPSGELAVNLVDQWHQASAESAGLTLGPSLSALIQT